MAAEDTNTENNYTAELVKKTVDVLNSKENIDLFTQFAWEICGAESDFSTPVKLEENEANLIQPGLKDIIFTKIATLGHRDKFPRQYDWENLIPTLAADEELFWIAHKKTDKTFDLFLGLKNNNQRIIHSSSFKSRSDRFQVLCDLFSKRSFPESSLVYQTPDETARELNSITEMPHAFCLTGMPSYKDSDTDKAISERDEEKRPFSSINDILEAHLHVDGEFYIVFSTAPAPGKYIQKSYNDKFSLKNLLKPLIEQTMNITQGHTWGTNSGLSITPAHETTSTSESVTKKHNCIKAAWRSIKGGDSAKTYSESTTHVPELRVTSSGSHDDHNTSVSGSYTVTNSKLKFVDEQLEESLKHLQQVPGTGGYFSIISVYSANKMLGESLSRSLKAALSGSQSYLHPIQTFEISGKKNYPFLTKPAYELLQENGFCPDVLNCEKACLMFLLPDADLPGLKLKKSVFYSRSENNEKANINLGTAAYFLNPISKSPRAEQQNFSVEDYKIPEKDLCSHVFLVGTTGSGKTERAAFILNNAGENSRLLILETAKKTYRNKINRANSNRKLCVYTLGNSQNNPFRINPFFFEPGSNIKQHIAVLADAIADLLPMEALIGPKLREAVENCYKNCGWDIETGICSGTICYPDMLSFNSEVNKICQSLKDYGPEVRSNYRGALLNRSRIFIDDVYQDIFAYDGNKTIDQLFPPDTDVIIEMEDMPPSEINMPAFIISILLHRIRASQTCKVAKNPSAKRFLVAIEEAHNVLARKFAEKTDESQSGKGGHLVNQVVRLLAEGRGLNIGIMVIDQSANTIAPAVIANSNMKIVFRQEDGEEIKTIGTAIGLQEDDWPDLQKLGTGECIVKSKSSFKPVKLAPLSGNDMLVQNTPYDDLLYKSSTVCAPYIYCEKILNHLYEQGVYTYFQCKEYYTLIARKCLFNEELIKYVVGRFLLQHNLFDLLDYWMCNYTQDGFTKIMLLAQYPRSEEENKNENEIAFLNALKMIVDLELPPVEGNGNILEGAKIICNKLRTDENSKKILVAFYGLIRQTIVCSPEEFNAYRKVVKEYLATPDLKYILWGFDQEEKMYEFNKNKFDLEVKKWNR